MICQPCKVDDHGNCTPAIGAVSLGMQDECLCWRYGEVHFVPAKVEPQPKGEYAGWTADEINEHRRSTGEDEFDWQESRRGLSIELEMED
ncbi:hypothetical protein LCGC14_1103840 [marine sediment metagenome]|uniref:Uncharacterized protein n=1 Tax=marine sediment metagenome TaxID=412755 RepID=A0A0F9PRX3_9ZZZZ